MRGLRLVSTALFLLPSIATASSPPDLAKVPRTIGKEPKYQSQPRYCLLVFGPDARERAWLVLDGETLYIDRQGTGDLTRSDCRVMGQADPSGGREFQAGDLTLGGRRYTGLQVHVGPAKWLAGSGLDEMPMVKEFLARQPDGPLYWVSVEVPFEKPFPDLRGGSPLMGTRHVAGEYDARGILQFTARPEQAPVIHFGGPWTVWPDGQQKLVRGRGEDLTLRVGTPGHGPGTFACICYDNLIPRPAGPHLSVEYPAAPGEAPRSQSYVLEDRC